MSFSSAIVFERRQKKSKKKTDGQKKGTHGLKIEREERERERERERVSVHLIYFIEKQKKKRTISWQKLKNQQLLRNTRNFKM